MARFQESTTAMRRIHIIGIGGSGMSAIAQVLLERGVRVSGSDQQANALTASLESAGATVFQGHLAGQVKGADVVLISSAVPSDNPEVRAARRAGIPVLKRGEFLGELMAGSLGIAVAGSHGKTTTCGMIAHALLQTDHDPSVVIGGILPALGRNGRSGRGRAFVIEADEYDHMFLGLRPQIAVITNIEHDHPDLFATQELYVRAFVKFARLLTDGGKLIACADDPGVQTLLRRLERTDVEILTYGHGDARVRALDARPNQLGGTDFLVEHDGTVLGIARLSVPGKHNVSNALAAIAVLVEYGLSFSDMMPALATFTGIGRRFEVLGERNGITIIDDYAHHPTEIRATLAAARQRFPEQQIWAVWQPHTFSRTRLLMQDFANSFSDADHVIALDIYHSREKDSLGISTEDVVSQMQHTDVRYIPSLASAAELLLDEAKTGDVILTMGAGNGNRVGRWVLAGLKDQKNGTVKQGTRGK